MLAAYMVPHPPMIIPEIGRGSEAQIEETIVAYRRAAEEIAALRPETIIISSPHSVMYADWFHVSPGRKASGDFSVYRASNVAFHESYDTELVQKICDLAEQRDLPVGTLGERDPALDHGTMIPLYFIEQLYHDFQIVRIGLSGLPLTTHYEAGMVIRDAVKETGRRAVFIGSGDLSHKLQTYGPYGFAPEGPEYDERIMDVCGRAAFGELFEFDEAFCEKAAECGHRSFVMMAGALDGMAVRTEKLSHQDVTGVGYGICTFTVTGEDRDRHFLAQYLEKEEKKASARQQDEDPLVRLARSSVESIVRTGRKLRITEWLSSAGTGSPDAGILTRMKNERAGVFVSIHEHGRLRGCIGTILPVTDCIAQEIIDNAVSASTRDPRFEPIRPDELKYLDISVDVLTAPERIPGPEYLDVKRYGVIVSAADARDRRRGLLLPDLDGVDTVEDQISIARQKAGLSEDDPVTLERFEVIRHH